MSRDTGVTRRRLPMINETADVWADVYEAFDRRLEAGVRLREKRDGQPSPCREGCSACCSKPALMEVLELPALERAVRELDPQARKRVRLRLREWTARAKKIGAEHFAVFRPGDLRRVARLGMRLDAARIPCPLLEADRCMIYAARPLQCRGHVVFSDPALCSDPDAIVCLADVRELLELTLDRVAQLLGEGGPPTEVRTIPGWLRVIFARLDQEQARASAASVEPPRSPPWPRER